MTVMALSLCTMKISGELKEGISGFFLMGHCVSPIHILAQKHGRDTKKVK